jgi:hypothetical protein
MYAIGHFMLAVVFMLATLFQQGVAVRTTPVHAPLAAPHGQARQTD